MRYHLRTLLIVLALGPPAMAVGWWTWREWEYRQKVRAVIEQDRQAYQYLRYIQEAQQRP